MYLFACKGLTKKARNPHFLPLPHSSKKGKTLKSTAFAGDKLGYHASALTRYTLFTQSWSTKAGSIEEERWNGQKAVNAGGRNGERMSLWLIEAKDGEGGFIRNHLGEWAEIAGGEKIKEATVAAKTRCRYQRCTVAFLPPLRGNSSLNLEVFCFSVIAPSTVVRRMSEFR